MTKLDAIREDDRIFQERKKSEAEGNPNEIKMGFLSILIFVVAIGNIQFGYAIGGWNVATKAYA